MWSRLQWFETYSYTSTRWHEIEGNGVDEVSHGEEDFDGEWLIDLSGARRGREPQGEVVTMHCGSESFELRFANYVCAARFMDRLIEAIEHKEPIFVISDRFLSFSQLIDKHQEQPGSTRDLPLHVSVSNATVPVPVIGTAEVS